MNIGRKTMPLSNIIFRNQSQNSVLVYPEPQKIYLKIYSKSEKNSDNFWQYFVICSRIVNFRYAVEAFTDTFPVTHSIKFSYQPDYHLMSGCNKETTRVILFNNYWKNNKFDPDLLTEGSSYYYRYKTILLDDT